MDKKRVKYTAKPGLMAALDIGSSKIACLIAQPFEAGQHVLASRGVEATAPAEAVAVPFTAQTRMSGVDLPANGVAARAVRKGAADSVKVWVQEEGGSVPPELQTIVDGVSSEGGTPLVPAPRLARRARNWTPATLTLLES